MLTNNHHSRSQERYAPLSMERVERFLQELKKEQQAKRYSIVTWQPKIQYFETLREAEKELAKTPVKFRGALIDLDTGETWIRKNIYRAVMGIMKRKGRRPKRFRRIGNIGELKKTR